VLQAEPRKDRHQALGSKVFRHAEAQHPLTGLVEQHIAGFLIKRQNAPRIGQQALTFRGGNHPALFAVEQLAAKAVLQTADLLADRRLGEMQTLRRPGEIGAVHHRDKTA